MAEMNDPYQSTKARTKTKGLSWSSWNIPEGMSESEALIRRERTRKSNRHMKHHDMEQLSRLPFDEMFLFGSHPESDVLSISQCPGCARRYKTQWLHNYHWEVSSSGDYLCSLTKSVIIPHRSSSKSDHHGHHHRESSKSLDAVHLHNSSSHPHSKQNNNLNVNPKLHHSSSSSSGKSSSSALLVSSKNENSKSSSKSGKTSLSSSSNSSSSSSSKPPLMTKAKAKMFPPTVSLPTVTNQSQGANSSSSGSIKLGSQSTSNSKSQGRLSSASTSAAATGGGGSYTLSIPSEDTGQNESVESLLQSNKSYSNGSSYGSKPIQIIATAVQKSSGKSGNIVEGEYEQMKFYSDSYSEKKSKTTSGHSSHGHGHSHSGSNHGHGHSHSSHSHGHSHGHSHSHSSKSSNENDGTGVLSPSGVSSSSSQLKSSKSSSSNSTILQSVTTNPSLLNFKIPLKSKSSSSSSGGGGGSVPSSGSSHLSPAATSSSSSSSSSQNSSKSKSKLSPKPSLSSPHYDSHRSPLHTSSGTGLSGSSTVTASAPHHHSSASTGTGLLSSSGGLSGSSTAQGGGSAGTSPAAYKSPGQLFPVGSPAKVEVKNEDLSPPPAKKKKKKKSKNEPRKVLPLKDRLFDPDQHCGVSNADSNVPCTRSLTCKTHSMALRRAVPGRSLGFDQLLAEHKKARDAEKAAKVALEQRQQGEMSPTPVFSPSSITPNSSSSGVTKTLTKGKLKSMDGNSGGVPSPLGASSLSNVNNTRSVPNSSSAQFSNSKTQQSLSYLQQAVTSPLLSPTVPKLEIISDTKSSLRLSTASPTHLNQLSSPKDPNSLMYESDEFPSRSPITGYKIPSSKSGSGSASSSSNYKIGPSSSLMSPSDLACESSSPKYPTNSSSLKSSGYPEMGYGCMETETVEPEIPQDPISAAIEMASAASALDIDSLLNDSSPDYSDYGVNQSQGVGSSSVPATSPFGFSSVGSASAGYSTALHQQNQSQTYSLTNSAFSNYSAASSTPDYQTCSFHSDTTDYQGEVSVSSSGYQQQIPSSLYPVAPNYSSAYTTYSQPQSSVSTMYQNPGLSSRYSASPGSVGAVFQGPTMFPTSSNSVYSGVTPSSSVYHPAGNPLYAATTSTLFPTEPPVFSIIEDLFSENPVSSIPPTGNHNLQIDPGGAGSNPDGFLKPFLSGSPAATPSGILLGASSSLSLNTSASTGLHLNPNSESLGLDLNSVSAFLELGMSNGDNGQPSSPMDGNSQKRAQSQIKRIKKLLAIQEKMNNLENNPEEYLVFHDLDNTEQAFVTIAALKEPVVKTRTLEETEAMKKSENGNENTTDSSEFDLGETNENGKVNLLKRNLIKRKMWSHFDAYAPFETQKQSSNTRSRDKGPLRKKIKLKKDKAEGKLSLVPYTGEPDRLLSTAVENDTQGTGAEAAKAIQMTVKSLGNYKGSEVGKKRRNLEKKYEELAEGEKEGEGRKESKMENFETKLGDWINDPHDFHTDVFSRIRRFRMKDILRHINNNNINSSDDSSNHTINNNNNCNTNSSSLNYEKRQGQEKRPMIQARNDVPALDSQQPHPHSIPARDTPEHPAVHNEIESFIDTIPSIDVEDPHSNTCRQL